MCLGFATVQGKDVFQDADGGCGGLARSNLFQRSCLETRRSLLCGDAAEFYTRAQSENTFWQMSRLSSSPGFETLHVHFLPACDLDFLVSRRHASIRDAYASWILGALSRPFSQEFCSLLGVPEWDFKERRQSACMAGAPNHTHYPQAPK